MFGHVIPDHWSAAIAIHFAHRVGALIVTMCLIALFAHIRSRYHERTELMRPATLIVALVAVQVTLGALTVLSRRDPWINSFHVVCGALVLTTSLLLTLRTWRGSFAYDEGTEPQTAQRPRRREHDLLSKTAANSTSTDVNAVRLQPDRPGRA
jgi:heme A synthase